MAYRRQNTKNLDGMRHMPCSRGPEEQEMKQQKTNIVNLPHFKNKRVVAGTAAALSLLTLAIGLATVTAPKALITAKAELPERRLAMAFGPLANQPSSVNVASILNTFQSPNSILGLNSVASQIQSRMQGLIPAGTPVWDGYGQLPGAIGTAGFNPSFSFDTSSCNIVPVTIPSRFSPSADLPTVWCGAVSNQTQPAMASNGVASPSISAPESDQARTIQFSPASRPAL